jgi:hypothetical protein
MVERTAAVIVTELQQELAPGTTAP